MVAEKNQHPATAKKVHPAVSIILPFRPMMQPKSMLEEYVKRSVDTAEAVFMEKYPLDVAIPAIVRLRLLIHKINYNTHKRSLAIFLSHDAEKLYYLDLEVEEKIIVDKELHITSIVDSKKQDARYLALLLSGQRCRIFLGKDSELTLIKSNGAANAYSQLSGVAEKIGNFTTSRQRKEFLLDTFLKQMDTDLSLLLRAYDLPVIVMAPEHILAWYNQITGNAEKMVAFVRGDFDASTEDDIRRNLVPYLRDWKKIRQLNALQEIEKAVMTDQAATGLEEVVKKAAHSKNKLLVLEENFMSANLLSPKPVERRRGHTRLSDNPDNREAIDEVILKVLQSGGDVEIVDNGLLKPYHGITLIRHA